MNVAITVWENRISPVFDSAETLLIAEVRGREVVAGKTQVFHIDMAARLMQLLRHHKVGVLICGALCVGSTALLEAHGIQVIPFMAGDAAQVLARYARGEDLSDFSMPGCRWRRCSRLSGEGVRPRGKIQQNKNLNNGGRRCQDSTEPVREEGDL